MRRIEVSEIITCPVEKAFAYTTDASKWPTYMAFIPEAEQTSPGPVKVGTTFRGVTRLMGRTLPWTATATEYQPPTKFGKNITSGSVLIGQHNLCEALANGTKVTIVYELTVKGFTRLLEPLMARSLREGLEKSLRTLKQILEK